MEAGSKPWVSGAVEIERRSKPSAGWAQTIVTGRGRINGIPVAVIAAETRSIERIDPADPANETSVENRVSLAGTVWFPDSSRKTATAIEDANREGLPLIIFANFRGFSGGMSDMAQAILKEGAKIVDGLSSYRQPVIVYLVPNGELRGGAWAVLDPSINEEYMTMFVDNESRGGVLEPEGIVESECTKADRGLILMDESNTASPKSRQPWPASTLSTASSSLRPNLHQPRQRTKQPRPPSSRLGRNTFPRLINRSRWSLRTCMIEADA